MNEQQLVVTAGGSLSATELAALVAALRDIAADATDARRAAASRPAWTRAALHEGVGGGAVAAPTDLDDDLGSACGS